MNIRSLLSVALACSMVASVPLMCKEEAAQVATATPVVLTPEEQHKIDVAIATDAAVQQAAEDREKARDEAERQKREELNKENNLQWRVEVLEQNSKTSTEEIQEAKQRSSRLSESLMRCAKAGGALVLLGAGTLGTAMFTPGVRGYGNLTHLVVAAYSLLGSAVISGDNMFNKKIATNNWYGEESNTRDFDAFSKAANVGIFAGSMGAAAMLIQKIFQHCMPVAA